MTTPLRKDFFDTVTPGPNDLPAAEYNRHAQRTDDAYDAALAAGSSNLVIGTTNGTAKDGAYQPTAANISDSTAIGRAVITAASEDLAQSAIGITATELFSRMTVRPSRARRTLIKSLISSLITSGIWPKLDGLYVFASHDVQAAKLNWVGAAQDITEVNGPTFQIDRGFSGDAATSYLDTNTPANTLEKFVSADASLGVYNRTSSASNIDISAGSAAYLLVNNGSGNCVMKANGGASVGGSYMTVSNASSPTGLFAWSRDASDVSLYHAGSLLNSQAVQTNSVPSTHVMFSRDAGGTSWSSHQLAAGFIGQGLVDLEMSDLNTALVTYLTAIGAN